jgi:O-antigen/teichoic acid export membrane protein
LIKLFKQRFSFLDTHLKEIIRGSSEAFILRIASAAVGFLFHLFIARYLGAEQAGAFFLAITVSTLLSTVGRLGMNNSLVRFVAANRQQDNWNAINGVYRKAISWSLIATILLTFSLVWLSDLLANNFFSKPELSKPLLIISFAIIPLALTFLNSSVFQGLKQISKSILLMGPIINATALIVIIVLGQSITLEQASIAYVSATIISLFSGVIWWIHTPGTSLNHGNFDSSELIKSCLPLFWFSTLFVFNKWVAQIMLAYWCTAKEVAIFSVAQRTAMLTAFILMAVNSIAAPKFSEFFVKNDWEKMRQTAKRTTLLMVLLASPILLVMLIAPSFIMGLFGKDFQTGKMVLIILALGQFFNVATGSVAYLLMMTGNEKIVQFNAIIATFVILTGGWILIPKFGALGGALSTTFSVCAQNILNWHHVKKHLAINTLNIWDTK